MPYQCRVERDSINAQGDRLTSLVISYPRRVLAEEVTHRQVYDNWGDLEVSWCERAATRDISKNSASSRAIPLSRMLEKVRDDPFDPLWTLNQKGMQGDRVTDNELIRKLNSVWEEARLANRGFAARLGLLGAHKQDCNRLLEPFVWITQIVTSSRWDNFFSLRCHEAADPHLRHVARMMYLAMRESTPTKLEHGQWHLPFVPLKQEASLHFCPDYDALARGDKIVVPDLIKFSAARCAWISYENAEKDATDEAMLSTFDRLMAAAPVHASPSEHQATPDPEADSVTYQLPGDLTRTLRSNLEGWVQHRKLIADEKVVKYAPSDAEVASWGMG